MPTDRPNVVLLVADDQRFDTISALGNEEIDTPNFDALVRAGTAFTRAYNMGSDSGAVCVPARAMLHSGRSLFRLEGPGQMTEAWPTLGEAFGNAGYRTFATGKWHNGTEAFNRSFGEGRSIFFGGMDNHWNVPICDRHPLGEYPELDSHPTNLGTGSVSPGRQIADRYASGTHSTECFANAAIDFIRDAASDDAPFFAAVATMEPHDPRTPPGEYLSRYDHESIDLPANFEPTHPFDNGALQIRDEELAGHPRDPAEIRRHIADYYASIEHLDHHLGRLLDVLAETGERGNTIVAITADHGLAVGQHGLMGKQNLYEHSVRVPLVLAGPGLPADERRETLCYQFDLNPTLRALTDLPIPDGMDARSLLPAIHDGESTRDTLVGSYHGSPGAEQLMVRDDRYKLIEYLGDAGRHTQLFDLATDPAETDSLADDPANGDRVRQLRDRLRSGLDALGGPVPEEISSE